MWFLVDLLILLPSYVFTQDIYNENNIYNNPANDGTYYTNPNLPNQIGYDRGLGYYQEDLRCPEHWVKFQTSCYRFIKSPLRPFIEAGRICQTFTADNHDQGSSNLVSVGSPEEHGFLVQQLNRIDPHHRRWYIGAQKQSSYYSNPDQTNLPNTENIFWEIDLQGKDYLAYNFSKEVMHWRLEPVTGRDPLLFICEANILTIQKLVGDERTYTYGIDIDNPERIPRGPYFLKQPVDVIFDTFNRNKNNDVSLSCLAGGYPTPTYKWYKEYYDKGELLAREIDPLTDVRYTVSGGLFIIHDPKQSSDQATYHCKATNKFGSIISESVQLNFGFITEFVLKRSPEIGNQNWGKSIYCDPPDYFPSVQFSWSRNVFEQLVEEDQRVFVSNDGTLYFSSLETIDAANYSCSVRSEFSYSGRNGPFFPLAVNPHSNYQRLEFTNHFPKAFPEAPIAGKDVRLECVVFGYPVPSYSWSRKGSSLPRNSYQSNYNRVLTISKVQVEDQGEYVCRAYNDHSSSEKSVILDIQAEPNYTIPLADKHIDKKGDLIWTCEAFGIPDVNYTWWKNGEKLDYLKLDPDDAGRIRIQDNVLTITNLNEERDPGMYQCRAANNLKTRYSSAQLRVLSFKPSFKKHPLETETYAAEGDSTTIKCNPEAAPHPKFVWKKDGNVIGTGGHRRIYDNGNLFIEKVSRDDEGVYTCTASNELGLDESKGRLIVLRAPQILEGLNPTMVLAVGGEINLKCYAVTDEMLDVAYTWSRNGIVIRDLDIKNSYYRIRIDNGYLRIENATFTDAGDYECIVKSAVGKQVSRSKVIVEGPPGPPGGVQVLSIEKRSVTLQWTDGAHHGSPISSYTISGRTNWNQTWVNISHGVSAVEIDRYTRRKEATIENHLTPWSVYEFRVAAWNDLGLGIPSAPSPRHSTPADSPSIYPHNIGGGGGKVSDLMITWTPLRPEERNGPGIYYKVFWKRLNFETEFQSKELREYGNTGFAVVHIPSEFYYTQYVVKVQAINDIGAGPISDEHVIYSAEDMPQVAPQLVVALSYNSTALNVSWVPIEQTRERVRGKLIGHRVKYWKKDTTEGDSVYYLSRTTRPWALIVGLQPDTYYFVKVMAYNAAGEGPESERYIERTFRKAPQKPPSSVRVYGVNPSTVKVVWRYVQPSTEEEPLQGYKIRIWEFDQDLSTANDTIVPFNGKLEGIISNLSPGKTYRMRVLAYSRGGDGRMSSPEQIFQMGNPQYFASSTTVVKPQVWLTALLLSICYVALRA